MWFETHAHLSDSKFDPDRADVVERAFSSGLSAIVEIADGPEEWPKARSLAERHPGKMWWAAGLHPYYADKSSAELWTELERITHHPQFVAVGEIGLDYAKCPIPPEQQKDAFRRGIELAQKAEKPVIIHCRDAFADLMPMVQQHFGQRSTLSPGVVHCFSGNRAQAEALVELGFYLGIDGPITYPSAKELRETIAAVPVSNLVLETDSPYLPPQTHRGKRNDPTLLPAIGTALAALLNLSPSDLAKTTRQNAQKLFRLNHAE